MERHAKGLKRKLNIRMSQTKAAARARLAENSTLIKCVRAVPAVAWRGMACPPARRGVWIGGVSLGGGATTHTRPCRAAMVWCARHPTRETNSECNQLRKDNIRFKRKIKELETNVYLLTVRLASPCASSDAPVVLTGPVSRPPPPAYPQRDAGGAPDGGSVAGSVASQTGGRGSRGASRRGGQRRGMNQSLSSSVSSLGQRPAVRGATAPSSDDPGA